MSDREEGFRLDVLRNVMTKSAAFWNRMILIF